MPRKTPSRPSRKAVRAAKHAALDVIMQEPEETVQFPVAFGRIAMTSAIWGAIALGVLALAVLSSAVFLMRDEVGDLARQLTAKDRELGILSGELQKVRDQMFGERQEVVEQGIRIVGVDTETGLMAELPASLVERDDYPIIAVAGPYIYQAKDDVIVRRELKTGVELEVLKSREPIANMIVSDNGEWLAYSISTSPDDELRRDVRMFVLPLLGRGDPVELGPWQIGHIGSIRPDGLSDDGKTLLTSEWLGGDAGCNGYKYHRLNVANGRETGLLEVSGCSGSSGDPSGEIAIGSTPDTTKLIVVDYEKRRLLARDFATGRDRVLHAFAEDETGVIHATLSLDGTQVAVIMGDEVFAVPVAGGEWRSVGKVSLEADSSEYIGIVYFPERFLLTVLPGLAGRYAYRNLMTGTIASADGPFAGIVGWSDATKMLVLALDTRE